MSVYHTCQDYHQNCSRINLNKLIKALKYTFKVYSIVHGAPMLIFSKKRQELFSSPIEALFNLLKKVFKSMGFLTFFITSLRAIFCLVRFRSTFDKLNILALCLSCTLGVLIEDPKRTEDYSVFTIPRILEGLWFILKKRGWVVDIPHSMKFVFALSMAAFLVLKVHYNSDMPESYKNQLSFVYGKEAVEEKEKNNEMNSGKNNEMNIEMNNGKKNEA